MHSLVSNRNTMNESHLTFDSMQLATRRIRKIHFIGIGGSGMSGIAEVLINLGYTVSGSDLHHNLLIERLVKLGAQIDIGHDEKIIAGADVVVISSAIELDNVELLAARKQRIPIVRRAEMLAELMRFRFGIAIAGTHGKTTTTSLIATILAEAKLDPTFIVGGKVNSIASHSKLGAGKYLVAEADESDASFLHLQPIIAVVTNVDTDHLATYEGDFAKLQDAFIEFLHNLPFYGLAVLCNEDQGIKTILPKVSRPYFTYGLSADADLYATDIHFDELRSKFIVRSNQKGMEFAINLNLPGQHNVLNALAAIAVSLELGIKVTEIQSSLSKFQGIARRFQLLGTISVNEKRALVVDDYGHHPAEIAATINAARAAWPQRRLVLVFQPHRYTRTRDLFDDFVSVLSSADVLVLLDVYSANEKKISGADSQALARALRTHSQIDPIYMNENSALHDILMNILNEGDVVLTQGAGNISAIAQSLIKQFGVDAP